MRGRMRQSGFTLIELVVSIVIIGIAVAAVLLPMNLTTSRSADPMIQHQAVAIAEAYMEEIMLRPFTDPDGTDGETDRTLFDDVDDYDGLNDTGARDQSDRGIAGLESYTVTVAVVDTALNGIADTDCKKVTVTVGHPSGINMTLSSYRTNY